MTKPNPYLEKLRRWLKAHPFNLGDQEDDFASAWETYVDETLAEFQAQPKWPVKKYKPREGRIERRVSTRSFSKYGHALSNSPTEEKRIDFNAGGNRVKPKVALAKFSWDKVELTPEGEE